MKIQTTILKVHLYTSFTLRFHWICSSTLYYVVYIVVCMSKGEKGLSAKARPLYSGIIIDLRPRTWSCTPALSCENMGVISNMKTIQKTPPELSDAAPLAPAAVLESDWDCEELPASSSVLEAWKRPVHIKTLQRVYVSIFIIRLYSLH